MSESDPTREERLQDALMAGDPEAVRTLIRVCDTTTWREMQGRPLTAFAVLGRAVLRAVPVGRRPTRNRERSERPALRTYRWMRNATAGTSCRWIGLQRLDDITAMWRVLATTRVPVSD